uniref:Uncharacterized protein n=1 Tax=Cyanistes caeruleus TaxID=156563 RepID=A0A8C0UMJ9_CYACU
MWSNPSFEPQTFCIKSIHLIIFIITCLIFKKKIKIKNAVLKSFVYLISDLGYSRHYTWIASDGLLYPFFLFFFSFMGICFHKTMVITK